MNATPRQTQARTNVDIAVTPNRALVDEPLSIRVTGLDAGQQVELVAEMPIQEGARGRATFEADADGVVDPSEQAPVGGDYDGVRPMGLVQFARIDVDDGEDTDEYDREFPLTLTARLEGEVVATQTVTRVLLADGVEKRPIDSDDLVGDVYLPPGDGPHPGIVFFGGSEGGVPDGATLKLLASHGYAVLALAYFQPPEAAYGGDTDDDRDWSLLPEEAVEIPLEYVDAGVEWFSARADVRDSPLGVVGASIGADIALVSATRHDDIETAVAYAPGGVIMEGISQESNPVGALVAEDGESPPYVEYRTFRQFLKMLWCRVRRRPVEIARFYNEGLDKASDDEIAAATVPVEEVGGPVLLVSGGDDRLRDAERFGNLVVEQAQASAEDPPVEHLVYEDAGHWIGPPYFPCSGRQTAPFFMGLEMALGGTPEAYARADTDSWPRVLETLEKALTDQEA